eukprot:703536-Pleurochrysis_carterae.AAC.5
MKAEVPTTSAEDVRHSVLKSLYSDVKHRIMGKDPEENSLKAMVLGKSMYSQNRCPSAQGNLNYAPTTGQGSLLTYSTT